LGSGYQITLKDLKTREVKNISSKEQLGNVNGMGLNLYCQMLSETTERIKKN
jgi:transcription-repair coupling factor (superfamily II helicase)